MLRASPSSGSHAEAMGDRPSPLGTRRPASGGSARDSACAGAGTRGLHGHRSPGTCTGSHGAQGMATLGAGMPSRAFPNKTLLGTVGCATSPLCRGAFPQMGFAEAACGDAARGASEAAVNAPCPCAMGPRRGEV